MNSAADDVAHYIASQGTVGAFGGTARWSVHVGSEPDSPADVVTIYDTGGVGPDTEQLDLEGPSFQVRVRSQNYPAAYGIHREIRDLLIHQSPIDMTSSTFIGISMTSDILSIGRDDQKNFLLVANYLAIRTQKE